MLYHISYLSLPPVIVLILSLLRFLQSFRANPISAIQDILVVLSLVLVDFLSHVGWLRTVGVLVPMFLLTIAAFVLTWASAVAYVQRKLILWGQNDPNQEQSLLGGPLFFPSQLTHARMLPEKYYYGVDYFLVGIPVGLRGRVGTLMAIDSDGTYPHAHVTSFQGSMKKLFRKTFWFGIDTRQYLHRGDGHMSLTQELELFLKKRVRQFRIKDCIQR